ncbi:N-(5'-phosphoribosyl)anthranilate isomerase [Aliigemmobacter aestuarii]|uniref:N-(5'-phosphoribosyl)anthranilate isomerase n=1 Tax=Aliigemmobacter aestuarii TaxID=1445661 RepID=UPI001FE81A90|nr:N-(5'-phosphoribosyl)anthranilate isomerase [Gemmobacter aestuarii]
MNQFRHPAPPAPASVKPFAPVLPRGGPDRWIALIFAAKSANGGVIRRNRFWVEKEVGLERFELEVRRRGFHMLEAGNQLIVICHNGPVRFLF